MSKYHIIANKQVKPCNHKTSCPAKFGQYDSLEKANEALVALSAPVTLEKKAETTVPVADVTELTVPEELDEDSTDVDEQFNGIVDTLFGADEGNEDVEDEIEPLELNLSTDFDSADDYFDDDEEMLRSVDTKLSETDDSALFKQADGVIRWDLENFYNEDGKQYKKYTLKQNPPILKIEDSHGSKVEFVLTEELVKSLSGTFDKVYRGYFNVSPRKDKNSKTKWQETLESMEMHPIRTVFIVGVVLAALLLAFIL